MKERILIFGAGVIGSVYGGLLAKAGYAVTLLARGKRLKDLREKGLLLQRASQPDCERPSATVIDELRPDDVYDYVFVTLRAEQLETALPILAANASSTFVFMVNQAEGYVGWEACLGRGRVIAAFPGAGGRIDAEGRLIYRLTSRFVQATTLGEVDGSLSARLYALQKILCRAGFPTALSRRMAAWQKTHLALVCPLALAIYCDGGNSRSLATNRAVLAELGRALKENLDFIRRSGIGIEPRRYRGLALIPQPLLRFLLSRLYASAWAEIFIDSHTRQARGEMLYLTESFLALADRHGFALKALGALFEGSGAYCVSNSDAGAGVGQ